MREMQIQHRRSRSLPALAAVGAALAILAVSPAPAGAVEPPRPPARAQNPARAVWDLLIWRPLGLLQLAAGAALFPVFYPASLATGGSDHVIDYLIRDPLDQTFRRPLGG